MCATKSYTVQLGLLALQPSWLGVMERAQRRKPGIVAGCTMASAPGSCVGLYHNVCGTLNGRRLGDGSMLYGCTCNLSLDLGRVAQDFDASFTEVRLRAPRQKPALVPYQFPGCRKGASTCTRCTSCNLLDLCRTDQAFDAYLHPGVSFDVIVIVIVIV